MQGDLDNPPITISTSYVLNYGGLIICGLGIVYGMWQLGGAHGLDSINIAFILVLFGTGLLYFAWQSLSPSTLTIAPDGVTWGNTWGKRHWSWADIGNFKRMPMGAVGCDLYDENAPKRALRKFNKWSGGSHGALGFGWEGGSEKVVALLQAAERRWSERRSSS